jgi:hypothetical protein
VAIRENDTITRKAKELIYLFPITIKPGGSSTTVNINLI